MSPDPARVLAAFGAKLGVEIAPRLTGFDANGAAMMGYMLTMAGELWDGAAARLSQENEAIRALLRDAAAARPADPPTPRLAALADGRGTDLRVSALEAENDALNAALIELHAALEDDPSPQARALEDRVWAEIAAGVERRRVSLANF